jgi:hypothetical protein
MTRGYKKQLDQILEEELKGKNACHFEKMAKGMQLAMKVQWVPPTLRSKWKGC